MEAQPVLSVTVEPKTERDRQSLEAALRQLALDDPTFDTTIHTESGRTVISGMGELHLEILIDRLKQEHRVEVSRVGQPQVIYRGNAEPIMTLQVVVPAALASTVLADLHSRRGRIEAVEDRGDSKVIMAMVPLAEMLGYAIHLRGQTKSRATYAMHFAHFEERPHSH